MPMRFAGKGFSCSVKLYYKGNPSGSFDDHAGRLILAGKQLFLDIRPELVEEIVRGVGPRRERAPQHGVARMAESVGIPAIGQKGDAAHKRLSDGVSRSAGGYSIARAKV